MVYGLEVSPSCLTTTRYMATIMVAKLKPPSGGRTGYPWWLEHMGGHRSATTLWPRVEERPPFAVRLFFFNFLKLFYSLK